MQSFDNIIPYVIYSDIINFRIKISINFVQPLRINYMNINKIVKSLLHI